MTGQSYGSGTGDDYATVKYDSSGNQLWVQRYNGPGNRNDVAYAIALDSEGNVYVTGTIGSSDYATIKYSYSSMVNTAPQALITLPSTGFVEAVGVPIQFTGEIIDPDTGDTHTAMWTISSEVLTEDVSFSGSVTGLSISDTVDFTDAGIYSIKLTVTDSYGESDETSIVNDDPESPAFLVIYDPEGCFVTGGGWIYSPARALLYTTAEGKANFGFVSKYLKGANVPTGNTEFRFQAGDFGFKSSSYE